MSSYSIKDEIGADAIGRENITNHTESLHYDVDNTTATSNFNIDFLKAETGEGDIESYVNHALNFNNSKGMARVLRGLTGMFDHNLNFAIVDIIIGALDLMKSKPKAPTNAVYQ